MNEDVMTTELGHSDKPGPFCDAAGAVQKASQGSVQIAAPKPLSPADNHWEVEAIALKLATLNKLLRTAEASQKKLRASLLAELQEHGSFRTARVKAFIKLRPGWATFDEQIFAADHPEIDLARYRVRRPSVEKVIARCLRRDDDIDAAAFLEELWSRMGGGLISHLKN